MAEGDEMRHLDGLNLPGRGCISNLALKRVSSKVESGLAWQ